MTEIEKNLNEVDTPKEAVNQSLKRQELKGLINNGQADKLPGKTLWTCNRIDKATDKVIDKLYGECHIKKTKIKTHQQGDMNGIASKMLGVRDINELRRDINKNPLIRGSITNMLASSSIVIEGYTPLEKLGAVVYGKYGTYLGPVALACEIFNHMNWENFAKIAAEEQNKKEEKEEEEIVDEFDPEIIYK